MASQPTQRDFPWIASGDVAHRGLFRAGTKAEENTLPAFKAALEAGFAIELDVRTTSDDIVVVFHDDTLERMTNAKGEVSNWGFQQLQKHNVGNSGLPIPSLPDVLEAVDGKQPIYVEIKTRLDKDIQKVCAGVRHCFEGYAGPVAVMSFDPRVVKWFATYMPKYARGLIIGRDALLKIRNRMLLGFWASRTKPDFFACDINLLPNSFARRWRERGGKLLTWTVRTPEMEQIARQYADAVIFEAPAVVGDQD
ncbi:glycerophosphodiester phosphodiesterase family protein [Kordiimonas marina]|uniref:glycerophosphodiester phosphodiesterase family protein n=1 Tax=Kordiimonas marina TaxID=2872312 RepID=UPI001FF1F17B|nr:glycerophosphodiester phosphodiesterase family protein [Kordiimonas marina]MCJ9429237.1 hypothetical protein [Kordiimonas marina]